MNSPNPLEIKPIIVYLLNIISVTDYRRMSLVSSNWNNAIKYIISARLPSKEEFLLACQNGDVAYIKKHQWPLQWLTEGFKEVCIFAENKSGGTFMVKYFLTILSKLPYSQRAQAGKWQKYIGYMSLSFTINEVKPYNKTLLMCAGIRPKFQMKNALIRDDVNWLMTMTEWFGFDEYSMYSYWALKYDAAEIYMQILTHKFIKNLRLTAPAMHLRQDERAILADYKSTPIKANCEKALKKYSASLGVDYKIAVLLANNALVFGNLRLLDELLAEYPILLRRVNISALTMSCLKYDNICEFIFTQSPAQIPPLPSGLFPDVTITNNGKILSYLNATFASCDMNTITTMFNLFENLHRQHPFPSIMAPHLEIGDLCSISFAQIITNDKLVSADKLKLIMLIIDFVQGNVIKAVADLWIIHLIEILVQNKHGCLDVNIEEAILLMARPSCTNKKWRELAGTAAANNHTRLAMNMLKSEKLDKDEITFMLSMCCRYHDATAMQYFIKRWNMILDNKVNEAAHKRGKFNKFMRFIKEQYGRIKCAECDQYIDKHGILISMRLSSDKKK